MTRLFGVIGHPIGHSLSPVMHAAALRALRVDALYAPFEAPPRFLRILLRALVLAGVEGLNVTVPLKEAVIPLVDHLDPVARAIGAVNTIVVRGRRLTGHNTDATGFARALRELDPRPLAAHAVILGAGGAARAVTWALAQEGLRRLTIANRHPAKARTLARWLTQFAPRATLAVKPLDGLRLEGVDLLINATTIGMRAGDPSPVSLAGLARTAVVYDLVYHRRTALVREARRRGCVAANGLSMLLYQGAESLRLWLNRPPPVEVMRRALLRALA